MAIPLPHRLIFLGIIFTEVAPFGGMKSSGTNARDRNTVWTIIWKTNICVSAR